MTGKYTFIFLITLFLFPLIMDAQRTYQPKKIKQKEKTEEENPFPRFEFGINFGTYLPNKYSANYYNGSDRNVNSINYILKNYYWYQQVRQEFNADSVVLREFPRDMHYSVTLMGGLFFRYNITRNNGIFLQINYSQLKTDDAFTVELNPQHYAFPDLRVCGIHGREERVNFDLGYQRKFPVYKNKMNLFFQGGANMNYSKVLKAYINFTDKEYSIINLYGSQKYIPGTNMQEVQNYQGGFGYGIIAGGGIGFTFTPQLGLELGGYVNYIKVNLERYDKFKPSEGIYLRFILSNIINGEE